MPTDSVGFPLTMKATESSLTYADIISLTLNNMKKRRDKFHQMNQLRGSEWNYFDNYLKALQDNILRYLRGIRDVALFRHLAVVAHTIMIFHWGAEPCNRLSIFSFPVLRM